MCSSCGGSSSNNLKRQQQQYATVNSLEAQSEYEAAMSMHTRAVDNRAVKRNKELQQRNKKRYR